MHCLKTLQNNNNQVDLLKEPKIHPRIQKIVKKYSINHFFSSAKSNQGIDDLFMQTVKNADDLGYINNFNMNHRETIIDNNSTRNPKKKQKREGCC